MKKVFLMLLLVHLLASVSGQDYDFSAVCSTGQTLYYKIINDTAVSVLKGSGCVPIPTGDLVVPATVNNVGNTYTVTIIGDFSDCSDLTSVVIPNSARTIGQESFRDCNSLTSIEIPNSVTVIGPNAFENCTSITSITIPSSVTTIYFAFRGCSALESIVVESSNTVYDSRDNCNAIIETSTNKLMAGCRNTVIPSSVTKIDGYAFSGCTALTSITIPNSITSIGYSAFRGCSGLTTITVDENNSFYDSRDNCNAIIKTSTNELISGCQNTVIPNTVTSIRQYAFAGCTTLTSVVIPNSVTGIWEGIFMNCSNLTSVVIPNSLTSIPQSTFEGCTGLTSIEIPNSVTTIGDCAFSGCTGLTSVTIPNSVTTIGVCAFSGCTGLTSVTIPNSVTSIGGEAFQGCSNLTSITIPNSVTSIGQSVFSGCTSLTSVTIPNSVTDIWGNAFANCCSLTSITIPSSVTDIGYDILTNCSNLSSIVVGNGNTVYDSRDNCNAIIKTDENKLVVGCQSTIIPSSITAIGEDAFWGMTGLTSLHIPASVTSIGIQLLSDCSGLTSITVDANSPNYDSRDSCNAIMETATNILVAGCQNTVIPSSTAILEENAFYGCTGLSTVTIPEGVTTLRGWVFYNCTGLNTLTFPASVTAIGDHVLDGCINLTSLCSWNETPPALAGAVCDAFNGIDENIPVYIPYGTTAAYQEAWPYFTNFIESTVGIEQYGAADFTLYPNPTTGMVNVQFTMNNRQWKNAEIQVFDVYGRLLNTVEMCHGASLQIDLSSYTPGVYLIQLVGDGRVMGVRKVLKK